MPEHLRFGPDYQEEVTLQDGTRVRLRRLRPSDKDKLVRGLARFSPESQYRRFFTTKARFTAAELRYLTEFDGYNHLAIGASEITPDGQEGEGIGVARFVRLPDEPEVAEPAVAVIDARQGLGLGKILMARLVEAALERGIRRFRSEFLATNRPMRELLKEVSSTARFRGDGPVVEVECPLVPVAALQAARETAEPVPVDKGPIFEWLRLVADKTVQLRRLFGWWLTPDAIREGLSRLQRQDEDDASMPRPAGRSSGD